jgi:hypothetical protein
MAPLKGGKAGCQSGPVSMQQGTHPPFNCSAKMDSDLICNQAAGKASEVAEQGMRCTHIGGRQRVP